VSPYRRAAGVPRNGTNKLYERATVVRRQAELRVTPHTHCYAPGITSGLLQMHLELHADIARNKGLPAVRWHKTRASSARSVPSPKRWVR
jgi:hypothetical protein